MSTIKDNILEEALSSIGNRTVEKKNENKLKTFQKRARISVEAIFIIKHLCNCGWTVERIAARAHVLELTVRKWLDGEAVPHLNNLLVLRSIRDDHDRRMADKV